MILGKPKNLDNFLEVNSDRAKVLHELGFEPFYRDENNIYFLINEELAKVVKEKWNLIIKY